MSQLSAKVPDFSSNSKVTFNLPQAKSVFGQIIVAKEKKKWFSFGQIC